MKDTDQSILSEDLQNRLVRRSADFESAVCQDIQDYNEKVLTKIEVQYMKLTLLCYSRINCYFLLAGLYHFA